MLEQANQADGTVTSPSPGTSEGTPVFTPEQQAQIDQSTAKAVSDALATAGRDAKTLETDRKANDAARKTLDNERLTLRRSQETAEDAAARTSEDPDAFRNLTASRELRRREEALATERETLEERERNVNATASVANANKIAAELKVDSGTLLKYTDGSEAEMREFAKLLPPQGETTPQTKTSAIKPDPGTGNGVATLSWQQAQQIKNVSDMSDEAYEKFVA
ncbi:hypothetical protein LCGC14_1375740 [marine sediment metagenome]|uniref:Uncharacterized protein n=1 Tax=marine sediment metagenome TaxID=412755 RepID=A0A0F9KQ19_9ZZZZ